MSNNNPQNGTGANVEDFLHDHQEKRKLLDRWPHYFPHEPLKDFDVSKQFNSHFLLAQRFQTSLHSSILRSF
jgi:hypothetical protein